MRLPSSHREQSLEVKMTPMIDVVFLLLVFFVWTSSFELPEFDLPSSMAQPPTMGSKRSQTAMPPPEIFDEILIRMIPNVPEPHELAFRLELNGQEIADLTVLRQRIREILALGVQPPVIVDPDPALSIADAVRVYDAARAAGADRVLFAAKAE
ncbi:biopolymer transporter ExbD [Novipirellula artificiosorum]|uniref:Biopolymer transport protein ExbD/TolR n=1 Tax=Novipirellula artificiosorum TaxID=2528016 RepID=A0A5C6D105_9BACT|nr:biopolymer transporter ExbD [Novipirellula artificiosorum]TWU30560.1 Biopolymer transport protein ExbD/TolR [Novipirellula artificiosorum]